MSDFLLGFFVGAPLWVLLTFCALVLHHLRDQHRAADRQAHALREEWRRMRDAR